MFQYISSNVFSDIIVVYKISKVNCISSKLEGNVQYEEQRAQNYNPQGGKGGRGKLNVYIAAAERDHVIFIQERSPAIFAHCFLKEYNAPAKCADNIQSVAESLIMPQNSKQDHE